MKFCGALIVVTLLAGCGREQPLYFDGAAQGTSYHITVAACTPQQSVAALQPLVEMRLAELDRALSNYRDDSQLSRFNRAPLNEWIELGRDLHAVLQLSEQLSRESGGVFDVTVAPLLALWGFGPQAEQVPSIPAAAAIDAMRERVGYRGLDIDPMQTRARKQRDLIVDINGIAQGYSVDRIADVLSARGCTDFLVELGRELRLVGHSAAGKPWRIGIEIPLGLAAAQQTLAGSGIGITTAGDYRDYFERDGTRYSHTIDPRSGRPINHKLASVTVIAPSAALADGYDTVLEVLGPEAGLAFARKHELAAYFIVRDGDGFRTFYSEAMATYLGNL